MIDSLARWRDRFLGRGAASVTVPPLDGALKPNNLIEEAEPGIVIAEPDNLVRLGDTSLFSSGNQIRDFDREILTLQSPPTALATSPGGSLAVACEDGTLSVFASDLRAAPVRSMTLAAVTAMAFADDTTLLACVGSATTPLREWQRDLLTEGASGSLWRIALATGESVRITGDLAFPYGVLPLADGTVVVSEAWRKHLVRIDARGAIAGQMLEDLPGYPARITPSARGGYWLSVFAPRSQLIEFVLREPEYRRAMMEKVPQDLWIAPALRSGRSFREPMQGGALKQMGILKPWAPTRSYGLVIELNADFLPIRSFHSRAGGKRHGITSVLEDNGRVWMTSRGGHEIISLNAARQAG